MWVVILISPLSPYTTPVPCNFPFSFPFDSPLSLESSNLKNIDTYMYI